MEEKSKIQSDVKEDGEKSGTFLGSRILFFLLIAIHVFWFVLGVAKIVIGALYIDDCNREQMIPIWLIVDAFVPILFVVGFVPHYKEGSSDAMKQYGRICLIVAVFVYAGWSICGGVFIYPNWNGDGDCNRVVAVFSFVSITINWSVIGAWGQIVFRLTGPMCCSCCGPKMYP